MPNDETVRAFVALPLSEELHDALARVQERLRRNYGGRSIRWVKPSSIHLTLFFLGDTPTHQLPSIREALAVVSRNVPPFEFRVEGLGVFPNYRRPRVIWASMEEPTGYLELLHGAVNEALARVGCEPDRRPFHPHLTLGRVRRRASRQEAQEIGELVERTTPGLLGEGEAREIVLFRSDLKPTGAEYTPLERFDLK
jgi:2'-5' RNA ligase